MKRYGLISSGASTPNGGEWTPNEWRETSGAGTLSGRGWFKCYTHPLLAVFLRYIHELIEQPVLWEVEVKGKCLTQRGLREGWTKMRLLKEVTMPKVTLEQCIAFGVLAALEVCEDKRAKEWGEKWLSGEDRSGASAYILMADLPESDEPIWLLDPFIKLAEAVTWAVDYYNEEVDEDAVMTWAGDAIVDATVAARISRKPLNLALLAERAVSDY